MSEQPPPPAYQPPPPPPSVSAVGRPGDLMTRFLAKLIDWVLLAVVMGVVFAFAGLATFGFGGRGGYFFGVLSSVLSTAIVLGYYAFMESNSGQTVGKMLLKLKVENLAGAKPTMEQAIRRNAYFALSLLGIIPFLGGLISGLASLAAVIYIAVTISNDAVTRRGWHDQFGETRVVTTG